MVYMFERIVFINNNEIQHNGNFGKSQKEFYCEIFIYYQFTELAVINLHYPLHISSPFTLKTNFRLSTIVTQAHFTMIKEYFSSRKKTLSSPFDSSSKKKNPRQVDRFIPHSVSKNLYSLFQDSKPQEQNQSNSTHISHCKKYQNFLQQNFINDSTSKHHVKLLHFGEENAKLNFEKENIDFNLQFVFQNEKHKSKKPKKLSKQPYKILDAPLLKDDFYLNLVDWSKQNNIGVGLKSGLFVWSGCSSKVTKIYESLNAYEEVNSVGFIPQSSKISIGTNQGKVKIFDLHKPLVQVSMENLHSGRIGSLGCTNNLIITGSKDGYVSIQDFRIYNEVFRYKAHQQQISGLKVSPNQEMVATGGNDNKLQLFSLRMMEKMFAWTEHQAAVKAISFNPNHPSIASGGGTADKKIRIFSLQTFQKLSQMDTGSQICNMRFSPISNQLVTTHGYSLNQIILWKLDQSMELTKMDSLMGHKNRVLYLAGQHEGSRIVTGAGDQQLRLWKVFDESEHQNQISYDLR